MPRTAACSNMRTFVILTAVAFVVVAEEIEIKSWFPKAIPYWEGKSVLPKPTDSPNFTLDYNSNYTRTAKLYSYEKVVWVKNYQTKCIGCIHKASQREPGHSDCSQSQCGLYKISREFWNNAGQPHLPTTKNGSTFGVFRECAEHDTCAQHAIIEYWNRFGVDCDGNGKYNCLDLVLLYKGGRTEGCNRTLVESLAFWDDFTKCMN